MLASNQPYLEIAKEVERLRLHLNGSSLSLDRDKQELNRNIEELRRLMQLWDRNLSTRCLEMDRKIEQMNKAIYNLTTKTYD